MGFSMLVLSASNLAPWEGLETTCLWDQQHPGDLICAQQSRRTALRSGA